MAEFKTIELSNGTINLLYKHITMLTNSKYKEAIKVLQQRNRGYCAEDFAQEVLQLLLESFKTKTFSTMSKLKSFVNKIMEFHYLKEKRKYYYTMQRGSMQCVSIEDTVSSSSSDKSITYSDTIADSKQCMNIDLLDLYNLKSKKLQIIIKGNTYAIVELAHLHKLENQKNAYILSVNNFIDLQNNFGFKESCRHYKSMGFNMTKSMYENINNAIIYYLRQNNFISSIDDTSINEIKYATNVIKSKKPELLKQL